MKKLVLLFILLFTIGKGFSQNLNMDNVLNIKLKNTGPIISGNDVKGYYYFYNVDKADKKNVNYVIKVSDENLRPVNTVDIVRPKSFSLIEAEYNGSTFAFLFYNPKENSYEIITFDKSLKEIGKTVKKIVGASDSYFKMASASMDPGHSFLVAVENKGFLYYGFSESKKIKYSIDYYDNNLKLIWNSISPDLTTKELAIADDAFQSENYIGTLITRRESSTAKDASYDLLVNEVSSGKQLVKMELADKAYNIAANKITFDEATKNIMVFGEYYNLKEKEYKAASLGYFYLIVDMAGKVVQQKLISWEKDMAKVANSDKSGRMEKGARVFVHEIIRTSDGDVFVVGEQYKKAASGWGIASAVISNGRSNTSTVQLEVLNMVILQFDPKLNIKAVKVFEKDPHFHLLPAGAEFVGSKMLAYWAKSYGWFDYAYSQMQNDKQTFLCTYVNYNKEKGEKGKNTLGAIVYTPEKVFTIDKMDLNRKSTDYRVYRAKSGYIGVGEYFKKEKKFDVRLEKINY
ncbi:MAG TPA: DUF6770 family protein [Cytophagaceae bacterium]|jgi:DNA-binding GntR family transcriptional regulator